MAINRYPEGVASRELSGAIRYLSWVRTTPDEDQVREMVNRMIDDSPNLDALTWTRVELFILMFVVEDYPTTPMSEACRLNDYETVAKLIEKGASVNHVRGDVRTPIFETSNDDIKILLIENGADPDASFFRACFKTIVDDEKAYASGEAIRKMEGCLRVLKVHIEYGADVYAETKDGNNAILLVAWAHNIICLEYLLENYTFDINQQNNLGETSLIAACLRDYGGEEVVKLLLAQGADKTIKDKAGKTAYDHAVENGNISCAELLK